MTRAGRRRYGLRFQIDRDGRPCGRLDLGGKRLDLVFRQADRQHAILKAIPIENIAEARRDDATKTECRQRPNRVFARGAAAEIIASHENLGFPETRLVEDEIGIFNAVTGIAPRLEAIGAKLAALVSDQPIDRNDDFGIDIDPHQRSGGPGHPNEFVHCQ